MAHPWNKQKDGLSSSIQDYIDSRVDDVVRSAEATPEELPNFPDDDKAALLEAVELAVDEIDQSVAESTDSSQSGVSEVTKTAAKVVTGFFILSVAQRALSRIHGAAIARQPDDTDEAIDDAVRISKDDAEYISINELGESYAEMAEEHFKSIGDEEYVWNTTFHNSRDSHVANHKKVFRWDDPPATGHPGHEHNCQCYVTRKENETESNSRMTFKAETNGRKLSLKIHGAIVENAYYDDEVGAMQVVDAVNAFSPKSGDEISLSIYSRGGDAFAGAAIKSVLDQSDAYVTANIYGLAASAATTAAAGADKITIGESDHFLVHKGWTFTVGDDDDHLKTARDLAALNSSIALAWSKKTGKSKEEIIYLMAEDRLLTAQEALDIGLVDKIRGESAAKSECVGGFCAPQSAIDKMPDDLRDRYKMNGLIGQAMSFKNSQKLDDQNPNEANMKLDEALAQNKILENENKALAKKIKGLEDNQVTDEIRADLKAQVRNELAAERKEADSVSAALNDFEIKAEGNTANEMRINALKASGVDNADKHDEKTIVALFDYMIQSKKRTASEQEAEETGQNASGDSEPDEYMTSWEK